MVRIENNNNNTRRTIDKDEHDDNNNTIDPNDYNDPNDDNSDSYNNNNNNGLQLVSVREVISLLDHSNINNNNSNNNNNNTGTSSFSIESIPTTTIVTKLMHNTDSTRNENEYNNNNNIMVTSSGKYSPVKPSTTRYIVLVVFFILYSIIMGYVAGIQPINQWRYFSYHPFLITIGMIGIAGTSTMTKKLGGYNNTKIHAILGWLGNILSLIGCYIIYNNKEINGFGHLKSYHAYIGVFVIINCILLGMAGGIFLHPDFGIDKTNSTIRLAHKVASRITLLIAWINSFIGLYQLTSNTTLLLLYGLPLLLVVPFTLV